MLRARTQSDAERGKRDDDHKLRINATPGVSWYSSRGPLRRRRLALGVFLLALVYLFIHNLPEGIKRPSSRPSYSHDPFDLEKSEATPISLMHPIGNRPSSTKAPSKTDDYGHSGTDASLKYWFDGPIKFEALANSLFAISRTGGSRIFNKNVLFAASSLKSAGTLLPMACEMARWKRNDVHFAFMGREDMPMDVIKEVNGIPGHCGVWFHDARPDFGAESTDSRMGVSTSAALGHINNYMHPQAIIVDTSKHENAYFLNAIKARSAALLKTLILLPPRTDQSMLWLTRLDSASLSAYNKVNVNIIVHAQPSAAGSLIRLLQSLTRADYFDSAVPRLSIELPHAVDDDVTSFLADQFRWPPGASNGNSRQFDLHKRVSAGSTSPEQSSVRFLESFWPANRFLDHVLVLSPQVDLSPLFYHYLKYAILEYKYSLEAADTAKLHDSVLGIALSIPRTFINDSKAFVPPKHSQIMADTSGPSFLWNVPSSEAALYFGDKWVDVLEFTSKMLASPVKRAKEVATTYPAWLEYLYIFSRARGYSMLYPQLVGSALAVAHNELYIPPEEYSRPHSVPEIGVESDDFTADPATHLSLKQEEVITAKGSLLDIMEENILTPVTLLPMLSADGRALNSNDIKAEAEAFSEIFRSEVGQCRTKVPANKMLIKSDIGNLFCNEGEDRAASDGHEATENETEKTTQADADREVASKNGPTPSENAVVVDTMTEEGGDSTVAGTDPHSVDQSLKAEIASSAAQQPQPGAKEPIPDHVKEAERKATENIGTGGDSSSPKADDSTENWVEAQVKQNLANNYQKYGT